MLQQQHLEEDNESLRVENTNLTKVAKLLTENMKESVETSKKFVFLSMYDGMVNNFFFDWDHHLSFYRMELALIKLKQRNNELTAVKEKDSIDGQITDENDETTASNSNINSKRTVDTEQLSSSTNTSTATLDPSTTPGGERIVEMVNIWLPTS